MTLTWCVDLKTYTQKSFPPCTWQAATSHVACGIEVGIGYCLEKKGRTWGQAIKNQTPNLSPPFQLRTAHGAPNEAVCGFQRAIQELQERGLT